MARGRARPLAPPPPAHQFTALLLLLLLAVGMACEPLMVCDFATGTPRVFYSGGAPAGGVAAGDKVGARCAGMAV